MNNSGSDYTPKFTPIDQKNLMNNSYNGYATASLVLGIIAVVLNCLCAGCVIVSPILAILAVAFACTSKSRSLNKKMNGKAVAGLILGLISLVLTAATVLYLIFVAQITSPEFWEEYEQAYQEAYNQIQNQTTVFPRLRF